MKTITFKKGVFTTFLFTAIILLLSVSLHSVQAQNCSAPPAPSVNWSGCDKQSAFLIGANLSGADMNGANLSYAFLISANLTGANLTSANLSGASLSDSDMNNANLSGANLTNAEMTNTRLGNANLSGATLTGVRAISVQGTPTLPAGWQLIFGYLVGPGANLSYASLNYKNLSGANLSGANLSNANLSGANLSGANLSGANLSGANLTGVVSGGIIGTPSALPAGWQLVNGYLVPLLTATQSQVNTSCNGGCNGSATVVASGGVAPYTYSWSPSGGTAATASGLCAVTYTCTITDNALSTITKSFTITQPTAIVVSAASQTNVSCNGGSNGAASVNTSGGTPGYTYNWTPGTPTGDGTPSVTGLSAGTWTCTVTDANSCTKTQTFTITQPSAIVVSADPQSSVYCYTNNNGTASINIPTGGTGPYTYNWTSNINPTTFNVTRSVTGLRAGPVYTCTVMDSNGCTKSLDFIINTELSVSADTQTNVSCNGGNNGAAKVSGFGGARTAPEYGYYFNWTPGNPTGDGTRSVTGLSAGTWTCTVMDGNGCTKTQTFTITQPSAIAVSAASQTNVSCNGGSNGAASVNTSGGTPGYTYNWTPGTPTGDGTPSVTGLSAGTWTCTVTDANSCTKTQTFTITQPSAIVVSAASQTNVSCNGGSNGSASVTPSGGAGGYTYYWSPSGGTAATATGLSAGTWTCTVTDANSCTATSTFIITEPSPLEVSAASQTNEFCYRGYFGSASINIPTGGTAPYTYDWTPGNPTGDGTRSVNFLSAGTWTCTVTDNNGCTATLNFTITEPSPLQVSAASQTNVSCNGQNNGAASVNTTGGTPGYIYNWNPQPSIGDGTPSVSGLSAGTWTCYVTDSNGCYKTQEFYITVNDTQAPVISCQANITGVVATSAAGAIVNYTTPVGTDNCTGAITTRIAGYESGATFPIGTTTVTHLVTDAANLTAQCSFTVTVVGVAPELECTGNIFVSNDANQCGAIVTFDTFGTLGIPAALVTYSTSSGATTSGSVFPVGTTYVTATATNDFGSSSCSFGIYVNDADSPVISCQADITNVVATSATGAVVNYTIPVGTDNCTGANTTRIAGLASGATFPIGVTTVTHRVTDAAGLTAECSFTVTVVGVAPELQCNLDTFVSNDAGQCGAIVTFDTFGTLGIPAALVTYSTSSGATTSGSVFPVGTTYVTATATNDFGSSSCTFRISVYDEESPVITCQANITNVVATSAAGAVVNYTTPVGTDNCTGAITTRIAGLASGATFPIGVTTVTHRVTDAAGLTADCSFTVTVVGVAPAITCPANISVNNTTGQCGAAVTFAATETVGIPASVITYSIASGSNFSVGTTQVTATATNAVGSSSCTFDVIVNDTEKPVITCPANISATSNIGCATAVVVGTATATDNCGVDHVSGVRSDALALNALYPEGVTTITWTATDIHGIDSTICEQTVTVTGQQAVASISSQTICSGLPMSNIAVSGGVLGTTYSWTRDNGANVTGIATSGSGDISGGVLTNTTTVPVTVTFTIIPNYDGCAGKSITAIVIVNPKAETPVISGNAPFCQGSSVTLDAGSGYASYSWSNGATTQTTAVSNATPVSVSVTNSFGCSATSLSVTPVVNTLSVAPTSITPSVAIATPGSNFTLSVNGGSLGTAANWKWYTTSCGGTLVGTGASISVSQMVNTTYYVRAEGTCNTTACASVTVNIQCGASVIISSVGTTTVCPGTVVTLTPVGALSTGAQWRWDDDCDAVPSTSDSSATYTTASSFTVTPTCTTTYYLQSVGGACGVTGCLSVTVNVIAKPATPGTIAGLAIVCPSTSGTYSIAAVANATSYTWTAPSNATMVVAANGLSAVLTYSSAFVCGTLSVKANNCAGSSTAKTLAITKTATPATPGTISGLVSVCPSTSGSYSIAVVANATSYTWIAPTNATIVIAANGLSAVLTYSSTFVSGTLSVKANNCAGSSSAKTLAITKTAIPATPGAITGASPACAASTQTYSITAVPNATSYTWTLPTGMSYVANSSTTGTSIQVVLANTFSGGTLSVKATNCSGSSANVSKTLTASTLPTSAGTITGPTTVCKRAKRLTYSVAAATGFTFNWSVPSGAVITSGAGTNSIKVTWGTVSGNVSVTKVNACGSSAASTLAVSSATCRDTEDVVATLFKAVAYPNPFAENFMINVTSSSQEMVGLKVYDMIGRLIEQREVKVSDLENSTIGDHYPSGVYNILVTQGEEVKTVRVVKR